MSKGTATAPPAVGQIAKTTNPVTTVVRTNIGMLLGDGNLDRTVSLADFTIWGNGFGKTGTIQLDGDYNNSGSVTLADFTVWGNNFGKSLGVAAATAAPEPTTGLISMLALAGVSALRRRR